MASQAPSPGSQSARCVAHCWGPGNPQQKQDQSRNHPKYRKVSLKNRLQSECVWVLTQCKSVNACRHGYAPSWATSDNSNILLHLCKCSTVCVDMDLLACAPGYISVIWHAHMILNINLDECMDVLCWNYISVYNRYNLIQLCLNPSPRMWCICALTIHDNARTNAKARTQIKMGPHKTVITFFRSSFITSAKCHRRANYLSLTFEMEGWAQRACSNKLQKCTLRVSSNKHAKIKTQGMIFRPGCKLYELSFHKQGAWCTLPPFFSALLAGFRHGLETARLKDSAAI